MESKPVSLFSAGQWQPGVSCSCHQYSQLECGLWGRGGGELTHKSEPERLWRASLYLCFQQVSGGLEYLALVISIVSQSVGSCLHIKLHSLQLDRHSFALQQSTITY